ncbi:UPF0243 zinc-binding protein yacG [Desulfurobacterium thermolithotrophum DSM 11699]|uniref:UPF0243 zinc-binding protein yacG n=1 Tax=Desulfurobacterium thermolithotrophum (strain DSM 11699 / BSA) TaxID=868864 RepID=F0S471_DESTD|nr:DNA gyrase inhibitor YacG [Desulfurobacterium thermolithotrophum]ADY73643.1 UPF0243 zinc-binding protein yacG [Desulfurobacterium thermolithotrophum DSM 11699]
MKQIKCPNCGKETTWKDNPYRPFCSEKCKLADLSKWLNEEYTLFSEEPVVEEEADSRS